MDGSAQGDPAFVEFDLESVVLDFARLKNRSALPDIQGIYSYLNKPRFRLGHVYTDLDEPNLQTLGSWFSFLGIFPFTMPCLQATIARHRIRPGTQLFRMKVPEAALPLVWSGPLCPLAI